MAEIYRQGLGRRNKRTRRRSYRAVWLFVADMLGVTLTLLTAAATLIAVLCRYISPQTMGYLSTLVLVAPVIYMLDIVLLCYWVLRRGWWQMCIALAAVVLGTCYLSLYYRVELLRQYEGKYVERNFVRVMSYNVHGGAQEELVEYITSHKPDIICLQEIPSLSTTKNWQSLCERYAHTSPSGESGGGAEIFSRHRILRSGPIDTLRRSRAVWADVRIGGDTVRVVNLHLRTTQIVAEDTQFIEEHGYIYNSDSPGRLRSIAERLVENNRLRAGQAAIVARFVESSPYRVILCGDFNDVPLSYTHHTLLDSGLVDTFEQAASGYAYTFSQYYHMLRIDYILTSPALHVESYEVDNDVDISDHYPVFVRLKFNK